jgi:hypothetical protein
VPLEARYAKTDDVQAGDTSSASSGLPSGLYGDVVERWRTFGNPYELAHALAGLGRCLDRAGKDEAAIPAAEAAETFRRLGVQNLARLVGTA